MQTLPSLVIQRTTIPSVACSMASAGFAACMGGIILFLDELIPH